jgi:hypothetical protein
MQENASEFLIVVQGPVVNLVDTQILKEVVQLIEVCDIRVADECSSQCSSERRLRVLDNVILHQLGSVSVGFNCRLVLLEHLFKVVDSGFELLDALFTPVIFVEHLLDLRYGE